jgi:hypothetical protein
MFVLSKIDILTKLKNPYLIEPHEKQVFHEFEKSKDQNDQYEIYRVWGEADRDFNIIATQAEMKYCIEN